MLSWIEIDTARLRNNILEFRKVIPSTTAIMAVVKGNGYGHGLKEIAPVAAAAADWLGVNSIEEACVLTALGIRKPISILGYSEPSQADAIVENEYRQAIYRLDLAEALSRSALKQQRTAFIHLKIETGTNRQGIRAADLADFAAALLKMPGLRIEGAYTHFANIEDTLDPSFARLQQERFTSAIEVLRQAGAEPSIIHAAATAGMLLHTETHFGMVRLGIGAYGIWPSRETQVAARERGRSVSLAPVLTWKTRIVQAKNIVPGDFVGYGLTYRASRNMRIAVLPVGYYDGYSRALSNSGRILVRGQFAPVIGRVAMNMTMADITDIAAENDDEVVLLGRQQGNEIRAEELADKSGTIAYEFLGRINPLLPRVLLGRSGN